MWIWWYSTGEQQKGDAQQTRQTRLAELDSRMAEFMNEKKKTANEGVINRVGAARREVRRAMTETN